MLRDSSSRRKEKKEEKKRREEEKKRDPQRRLILFSEGKRKIVEHPHPHLCIDPVYESWMGWEKKLYQGRIN